MKNLILKSSYILLSLCFSVIFLNNPSAQDWNEIIRQTSSDVSYDDRFGYSVSISGSYAIVGAYMEDEDADGNNTMFSSGSAYIFYKDQGGTNKWGQVAKIVASDRAAEDGFGSSVSISGDYAIVGAIGEDEDAAGTNTMSWSGSAYIFYKDQGGTNKWGQVAKIVASDRAVNDYFGSSVSISGNYAIVGAYSEDEDVAGSNTMSEAGSAYIFYKDQGGTNKWGQVAKIVASDRAANDWFGDAVSISGNYAIVGADWEDEDAAGTNTMSRSGSAYIFYKDQGGTDKWGQVAKIVASDRAVNDYFGSSVSISGNYAIAGLKYEDEDAAGSNTMSEAGSAYIFYKDQGGTNKWGQVEKIVASDRAANDWFGCSVSISGDYAIIGANQEDEDALGGNTISYAGSAYVFHKDQGGINKWGQVAKIAASNRASGSDMAFGCSVSISENYAVIGAFCNSTPSGMSYIFQNVIQASNLIFSNLQHNQFSISWTIGDGTKRVVFMKQGNTGMANPDYNTTYSANALFGAGTEIGFTGWYCIYNGTGNNVTVTGLNENIEYRIMVCEYYGSAGSETYYRSPTSGNPATQRTISDFSTVGINVLNNQITGTTNLMQYSLNSTNGINGDWYDCSGNNTNVSFSEGDVYVRDKYIPTSYSLVGSIAAPADAPVYKINYYNETTLELVPATVEYNYDNNFSTSNYSGTGEEISLILGTTIYLRVKATASEFPSEVQTLVVPARPASTSYTIDFINETTAESIDSTDEYSLFNDFSEAIKGKQVQIPLTPGIDQFIRKRATYSSFSGEIQHLIVPSRPGAPNYTIDYLMESLTGTLSIEDEYSLNPAMSESITGENQIISLTPGVDLYIRSKSTLAAFSGLIQHLIVPERPIAPIVSLSDRNSQTAVFKKSNDGTGENVILADGLEYSLDGGNSWNNIAGTALVNATGMKYFIVRKRSTAVSFASEATENLDYEKPVVTVITKVSCNGPNDSVILKSNLDNGKVYLVLEGEPQSTISDLDFAVSSGKGKSKNVDVLNADIVVHASDLPAGTYYAYASNDWDSLSAKSEVAITIYAIPQVDLGDDIIKCEATEIILDPGAEYSSYAWNYNDAKTRSIKTTEENDYILSVSDDHGCENSDTVSVRFNIPYQEEQICVVTIEMATGNYVIVWEKTPDVGIIAYNIYRESTIGVYNNIGTIPYDELSIFKDTTANPESQAYLYKITVVDSCGSESLLASTRYHRPSFLQYVSSEGGVNLEWTDYAIQGVADIGEFLTSYAIYRGTDSTGLEEYQVVGSINTYTDTDPDALKWRYYYRVAAILKEPCYPTIGRKADTGPYSHSMSNIEDNRIKIPEGTLGFNKSDFKIIPNPFTEFATLKFRNPERDSYTLYLTDLSGKLCQVVNDITASEYVLEKGNLEAGLYFIELRGPKTYRGKIIVE